MHKDTIVRSALALVCYTGLLVGVTSWLQGGLLVFRHFGAMAHWAMILLLLPLLLGAALALGRVRYAELILIIGSGVAAAYLYPQYKIWWELPPTEKQALIFAVTTAGISNLGLFLTRVVQGLLQPKSRGLWAAVAPRRNVRPAARPRPAPLRRAAPRPAPAASGSYRVKPQPRKKFLAFLTSAEYSGMLATLQFLIAVISLSLSLSSIWSLSQ